MKINCSIIIHLSCINYHWYLFLVLICRFILLKIKKKIPKDFIGPSDYFFHKLNTNFQILLTTGAFQFVCLWSQAKDAYYSNGLKILRLSFGDSRQKRRFRTCGSGRSRRLPGSVQLFTLPSRLSTLPLGWLLLSLQNDLVAVPAVTSRHSSFPEGKRAIHSRILFQRAKKLLPPKACQQICLHYVTCRPFSLMRWGLSCLGLVTQAFPESQEQVPGSQSCVGVERMSRQNWSSALRVGGKDSYALKFAAWREHTVLSWAFF